MREEYKNIQCVTKKKGMKRYYNNTLKKEKTALYFEGIKNQDGV